MNRNVLTVTLNPVLDQLARLPAPALGKDFRLPEFMLSAGGKGINVSRALKNLQIKTLATGFTGGASGALIETMLTSEKIRHDFVRIIPETRKSVTIIDPKTAGISRLTEDGLAVPAGGRKLFLQKFKSLLRECSWLVLSGRPAQGIADSFYADLIRMARSQNIRTVLDTSGKSLQAGLGAAPFLVKPNREEAEDILGKRLRNISQLKRAAQYFLSRSVSTVIISLGGEGALAANRDECWLATSPKVRTLNTVGCGDALIAGYIYGYCDRGNLGQSLQTAVAVGAANCLSLQPGNIQFADVITHNLKVTGSNPVPATFTTDWEIVSYDSLPFVFSIQNIPVLTPC